MALIADGRLIVGKTYMFINKADGNRALAVWRDSLNAAGNLSNVCILGANSNDTAQHWKLVKINSNNYAFQCVANPQTYLDLYTGSGTGANSNAHLYEYEDDSDTCFLNFEVGTYSDTVRIKLAGTTKNGYYLTANVGSDGTKDGKSNTSAGNVFFQKYEIYGDAKDWIVNLISTTSGGDGTSEESDYSTGYYRFSNGGYYLTGTTNSVTAAAVNGQTTQTWNFSNNKLCTESSSSYGIAGTSSATMSTSPNSVVLVWAGTNKCYIKLSGSNKYLQRSSTTVSWGTTPTEWIIEEIIKKTGVPFWGTEYFSARAGESNGAWNATRTANLKLLFQKFYLNHSGSVSDARIGQNLYGALYSSAVPGKFHTGIDVNDGDAYNQYKIYSPIDGYIINCNTDNGAVCIYNEQQNFTIVLMHLQINSSIQNIASETLSSNNHITEGTLIGTQCGYSGGIYNAYASHLHFEFHDGRYTGNGAGLPSKSYDAIGSTVNPYDKIAAIVS